MVQKILQVNGGVRLGAIKASATVTVVGVLPNQYGTRYSNRRRDEIVFPIWERMTSRNWPARDPGSFARSAGGHRGCNGGPSGGVPPRRVDARKNCDFAARYTSAVGSQRLRPTRVVRLREAWAALDIEEHIEFAG